MKKTNSSVYNEHVDNAAIMWMLMLSGTVVGVITYLSVVITIIWWPDLNNYESGVGWHCLFPFVYAIFTLGSWYVAKDVFHIEFRTGLRWKVLSFLMGLLSPIAVVLYVLAMGTSAIVLLGWGALLSSFPTSVKFSFKTRDGTEDLKFLSSFENEFQTKLLGQGGSVVGFECGVSIVRSSDGNTFSVVLRGGGITRKLINQMKKFAESHGYSKVDIQVKRGE